MRAWLTPDDSFEWCEYVLNVPASLAPHFEGALVLLCNIENWELYGDMTPDDVAQIFTDQFADLEYGCCVFLFDDSGDLLTDMDGAILCEA